MVGIVRRTPELSEEIVLFSDNLTLSDVCYTVLTKVVRCAARGSISEGQYSTESPPNPSPGFGHPSIFSILAPGKQLIKPCTVSRPRRISAESPADCTT